MSDRLSPRREAEIAARWKHVPADEQPRLKVTDSSRPGTLLNALVHARHDVPALLAELDALRAELAHAVPHAREVALKWAANLVADHVPDEVHARLWNAAQDANGAANAALDEQQAVTR